MAIRWRATFMISGSAALLGSSSRRMMVTGGNVTGITDQLAAEGLVDRVDVEGDRRAYRVRLTPRGRKLFHEMAAQHEAWIVEAFGGLTDKDIASIKDDMKFLIDNDMMKGTVDVESLMLPGALAGSAQ